MIGTVARSAPAWLRHFMALHTRLSRKQADYLMVFARPEGKRVLVDLASFCCAHAPASTEREIGRRDVWLRIQRFIQMHDEELTALYANLTPEQRHQIWAPGVTYMEDE